MANLSHCALIAAAGAGSCRKLRCPAVGGAIGVGRTAPKALRRANGVLFERLGFVGAVLRHRPSVARSSHAPQFLPVVHQVQLPAGLGGAAEQRRLVGWRDVALLLGCRVLAGCMERQALQEGDWSVDKLECACAPAVWKGRRFRRATGV